MRIRRLFLLPVVLCGVAACGGIDKLVARDDWSPAALRSAESLAARIRAAGVKCDDYEVASFSAYSSATRRKVPLPDAMTSCTSEDDEDLTLETFDDDGRRQAFISSKRAFLCEAAAKQKAVAYPGFPYVEGEAWIIEPDEKGTADKLAKLLGGESKVASCDQK